MRKSVNDVDTAIMLFRNTFGYKDSVARSNKLEEIRDDIGHKLRKKEFDKAVAPVKKAYNKYKKVIYIAVCIIAVVIVLAITVPNKVNKIKESNYQKKLLNDYNSAVELFNKGSYAEAIEAMNDREYLSAYTKFKNISGYKDSDEKRKECAYAYAEIQYNDRDYRIAKNFYEKAEDYKDAQEK